MELVSFTVQNYRSIVKANRLPLSRSTVLVGPNNEGKSNILKALVTAMRVLSVWKDNAPQETHSSILLKRFNIYDWELDYPIALQQRKPNGESIFDVEFKLTAEETESFRSEIRSRLNDTLPIRISIDAKRCTIKVRKRGPGGKALSTKSRQIANFVSKRIACDYIPAIRTADSAQRIVEELIERELQVVENDPAYQEAMRKLAELQQPLLDKLGKSIQTTLIQFLPSVTSVKLEMETAKRYRAMRRSCDIIVDDGTPTSLQYKGDGVQSLAALGIMRHASDSGAKGKSLIIALEEPESHLHPRAIHQLRDVVQELAAKHQVVISTHCPLFINRIRMASNILVNNRRARTSRSIEELRAVLGVRASDNLRHAELVLVVEGEDDVKSLTALLKHWDSKLKTCIENGTLAIDSLGGSSNLGYKLGLLRDALCLSHVFLDHDDAGKSAYDSARNAGLIEDRDVNFVIVKGQLETEFEDVLETSLYDGMLINRFRVSTTHPKFKGRGKWSDRMGDVFQAIGKPWNDRVKGEVKRIISDLCEASPAIALQVNRRASFDGLVENLKQRLDEISEGHSV